MIEPKQPKPLNEQLRLRAYGYIAAASGSEPQRDWRLPRGQVRLLGNDLLEIPLWDDDGILTTDPDYLREVLGLDEDLIVDLVEWGLAYDAGPDEVEPEAYRKAGVSLTSRLRSALTRRFEVTSDYD